MSHPYIALQAPSPSAQKTKVYLVVGAAIIALVAIDRAVSALVSAAIQMLF